MLKIGLTGSIGTGKSFIANLFQEEGYLVLDSDQCVDEIYKSDQGFLKLIKKHFPETIKDKQIDRKLLGSIVFSNPQKLALLENYLHPKLKLHREAFIEKHTDQEMIIFDIPLLFEKGIDAEMDLVIVTYCDEMIQKERVSARDKMDEAKFFKIISMQLSGIKKKEKADYVIDTNGSKECSVASFKHVLAEIKHLHLL